MGITDKKSNVVPQLTAADSVESMTVIKSHDALSGSRKVHLSEQRLDSRGILTRNTVNSKMSEEYRLIKLPLLKNAFGKGASEIENGNLIMVTSSQPGEGKTHTAINLAMSISMEMDKKVLLVDADLARPSVIKVLGIEANVGLVDYLLNENMDFSEAMLLTNNPNLRILPCGKLFARATELIASAAMAGLAKELANRYPDRIVIFDAPPLLASSEAKVLSTLVGQIVMVVEAEKTLRYVFTEALSLLDEDKVIGLVLNKSRSPKGTDYYGTYTYHN